MLTCIAAGTLGYILFKRNASEVVAPADSDADGYDIEDTDEEDESTQEDEESEDDTDGTQTDSDTDDESEDSSGDEEVADDETSGDETADDDTSPTTEEWVVEEFSLSVPLTESRYHFVLDVPDFAYSDYQPEGYTVYSYDPQFSLSIITLPEAYGQELTGAQYLFNTSEFGDVYRVEQSDLNPDMYFYSNDVVTEGSCNILGTEVDAPCGATILGDDEGSFFEATCSGASTRGLEYCDEIVRSINLSLE
jgi:hypothetical protein